MKTYGYQIDASLVLCDNMTLPNDGAKDSEAIRWAGDQSGVAEIRVYAATDITVASDDSFIIEIECFSSASASNAAPPFANSSGWVDDAHFHLLYKDSGDGALSFAAGDLITAMAVPQGLLRERDWVQLRFSTDANLNTSRVDAFVRVIA